MKKLIGLAILTAVLVISTGTARANFSGSDDFSGTMGQWGDGGDGQPEDYGNGLMRFDDANDNVQYYTSGSSDMDYSYYKWAQNQGAYDSDWAISVDVAVPNWTMSSNEIVGVGFGITNSADPINDSFVIELEQGNHGSGSETSFTLDKMTDGNPGDEFDKTASALSGTVQIQYSSSDNKLYGFYNEGSGWNAMNPGGTGISDWGTVTAFNAFIVGTSENKSVDSGDGFTVDHFDAAATPIATTPEPSTYALFGIGLLGLFGGWIRKKIKK